MTITTTATLRRSSATQPQTSAGAFTVTYSNRSTVAPRNCRSDVNIQVQKLSRQDDQKNQTQAWATKQHASCNFPSQADEACALKMMVVEANRFQKVVGSTKLQEALTSRTQKEGALFHVDQVTSGVSPRVMAELLKDLDIVMGICQSDTQCRSPYQSTKKSLGTLPLWQSNEQ